MFSYLLSAVMILTQGDLLDMDPNILIDSLQPNQRVEIQAETLDTQGNKWTSHAYFKANEHGMLDLATAEPLPGSSYDEPDVSGLFWSMSPTNNSEPFFQSGDTFVVNMTVKADEDVILTEAIVRSIKAADIQTVELRENGLVGNLYLPSSDHPLPIIITLSGSEGKMSTSRSQLLAAHGFAVLALGYFGLEGLPFTLKEIPLEYFERVFAWLKTQNNVDASRIGLYGISRGAELALILGSLFPESIQSIVAVAPSSAIYGVFGIDAVHAWLYHGKPIAPLAMVSQPDFRTGNSPANPMTFRQNFLDGINDTSFEQSLIATEKIQCPILLISGGDDQVWPSDVYASQIMARAKECEHLYYPNAGHRIDLPYLPFADPVYYHSYANMWFSFGGTSQANAQACQDSWKKLVAFFQRTLNGRLGAISAL